RLLPAPEAQRSASTALASCFVSSMLFHRAAQKGQCSMQYLAAVDHTAPEFGEFYDELPLWSAPFGLLLLARVPMQPGLTVLDVGAGTGFLTMELAQRCGPTTTVIAVDPWAAGMRRLQRKLAQFGLTNVRLLEQDAATVDLPDASVDLVVS